MNTSRLTFHGGAGRVTGSNFLLEADNARLLVDCGLVQGAKFCDDCNREPFAYDPGSIDALFVTHGHIDHIGRVPKLVRDGFSGPIYSTAATRSLAAIMFEDAVGIMEEEAKEEDKEPLYGDEDVARALSLWKDVPYDEAFDIKGVSCRFHDAGHILGSAMVELSRGEGIGHRSVLFTGDLGNTPGSLLRPTATVTGVDYLVMESVYGDREHESPKARREALRDAARELYRRRGTMMIPAFSIDRTQLILYELEALFESDEVPSMPVFLDSPLAIKVTKLYREYAQNLNADVRREVAGGERIFSFPKLTLTESVEESKAIADTPGPKIIIAGSGMSAGGRILHHEKRYLPGSENMLVIVGYQAAGSRGRLLEEGAKSVEIHGKDVPVRASVRSIDGYSAHKDSAGLLDFVEPMADDLKRAFLVLGEPRSSLFLAQRLRDYLGVDASVPKEGESAELEL